MKCPGQDSRYWKPDAIFETECPHCGHPVEFFKDDTARKCGRCGERMVNPRMDFGCAAHCQYAEQCLGTLPPELVAQREDLLKDRVALAVKRHFGADFRKIGHAVRTARHAEAIGKAEKGNPAVILCAAYLLRIDETNAPTVAGELLTGLGAAPPLVAEVKDILGTPATPDAPLTCRVVYDADRIAALEEKPALETLAEILKSAFLTPAGADRAREVLKGNES